MKTNYTLVSVSAMEFLVLETVYNYGPCSAVHVTHLLGEDADLLLVLRTLNEMMDRGFLKRITINNSNFYETVPNYNEIRNSLSVDEHPRNIF
jgi:hypothetical protein